MRAANQIAELQQALKDLGLTKAEHIRVNSVLLRKKGYTLDQIADIAEQSVSAIEKWLATYNRLGLYGLRTQRSAGQNRSKLTSEQKEQLKQLVNGHKPMEYRLSGDFWSVPTLKQLITDRYGVVYKSAVSYRALLDYCGFSYQKAEHVDVKKESADAGHFKKRFEKRLKKRTISMWW